MSQTVTLWYGDCLDRLKEVKDNSVGTVCTDPPYDIAFMNREWDDNNVLRNDKIWREAHRILRPGAWLMAFSATRTYHRLCRTLIGVGFVDLRIRAWSHGQGFPKSTNISKMIDKQAGAERKVVGYKRGVGGENMNDIVRGKDVRQTTETGARGVGAYGTGAKQVAVDVPITMPATEIAQLWDGYGTALKPSWEVVVVGRKP